MSITREDSKQTITGTVTLTAIGSISRPPESCSGEDVYDDIDAGMNITVRNGDGAIVGASASRHLERKELETRGVDYDVFDKDGSADEILDARGGTMCVLGSTVEVDDADFYEITVGSRGELSESKRAELELNDWEVGYSSGSY